MKEEMKKVLTDDALVLVTAGGGTVITVDDTEIPEGGIKLIIDGVEVHFVDNGIDGFYGTANGIEYFFTYAEMAELLHRLLNE